MPKALFVLLQLSLGAFACFTTSPLLAQVTSDGTVNTQDGTVVLTAYRTNNAGDRLPETNSNCDRI